MGTFAVKIGTAEYEVDAPDEATAWKYANAEHTKPYDVPVGVKSAMNVGQAMTFGFGDEIAAKFGADSARYRNTVDRFREEYPKSAMLGSVSGSMLLPFGGAKLAATTSPLTAAATIGGVTGALQGAGDAKDMQSIPQSSSEGALLGMTAAPAILGMARPMASMAAGAATKIPFVGDDISQWLASRRVAQAFERDSTDADAVGRRMVQLGPEARVGDAAGENTYSLLDLNANLPGRTKNDLESVIRNRISTRPDRMDSAVYAVNGGYGRAGEVEKALTTQQKQVAGPLYQKAHSMEVSPSAQLVNDLEAAKKLGAFSEAEKRALANPEMGPFTLGQSQQKLGQGKIGVRDIDHIKQGIDSLIEGQTDSVTGKVTAYGRDLVALKKRILAEADTLTIDPKTGQSVFKAARDAYAGPAALKSAITKGRSFWSDNATRLEDQLADMSKSEQDAFRIGASEALREKVGSQTGQNQLLNIWKDRNTREKLKALLGDDVKYSEVEAMISGESALKRMEGLGPSRNSRTFSREAAADDQTMSLAEDAASLGSSAASGSFRPLLSMVARNSSRIASPEPVRDAIGKILLQQYQPAEMKALMEVQELLRRQQTAAAAATGVASGKVAASKKK